MEENQDKNLNEDKKEEKHEEKKEENKENKKEKKEKKEKKDKKEKKEKVKEPKAKKEKQQQNETNKQKQEIMESEYKVPPTIFQIDESGLIDYKKGLELYDLKKIELGDDNLKSSEIIGLNEIMNSFLEKDILVGGKNLDKLKNNKNIFLFYELIFNNHTQLALNEIFILDIIKNLLEKNPDLHLIIQISDDDLYSKGKFKFHEVSKFALEKTENVLKYISTEKNKNQIHIFSNSSFRLKDTNFESIVSNFKMKISYEKVIKLFNITEDDPVSALDYPCYIAMATNPEIYTNYIPQIKKDFTCLIINSIYNMNRYQLAFDAAKICNFNEPILLATKIIPPLTGINGYECNFNFIDNLILLSGDERKTLENKIKKHAISGSRGSGSLEDHQKLGGDVIKDIACQYLAFIEKNVEKYKETIDKFGKGQVTCGETKKMLVESADELFKIIREGKIDNNAIKDYFIIKDS